MFILNSERSNSPRILTKNYNIPSGMNHERSVYVGLIDLLEKESWGNKQLIEYCLQMKGKFYVRFCEHLKEEQDANKKWCTISVVYFARENGCYYLDDESYRPKNRDGFYMKYPGPLNDFSNNDAIFKLTKQYLCDEDEDTEKLTSILPTLPIRSILQYANELFSSNQLIIKYRIISKILSETAEEQFIDDLTMTLREAKSVYKKPIKSLLIYGLQNSLNKPLTLHSEFNDVCMDRLYFDIPIIIENNVKLKIQTLRCELANQQSIRNLFSSDGIENLFIDRLNYTNYRIDTNVSVKTIVFNHSFNNLDNKPSFIKLNEFRMNFPIEKLKNLENLQIIKEEKKDYVTKIGSSWGNSG